jgi:hypothetical protein
MISTLIRIFFGVDVALGFFNYAAWSWFMAQPFNVWFLLLSIASTHLPDVDMIPYLLLRRRYGLISHWIFGHHPLLVLPLAGFASFAARIWASTETGYITAIVTAGVFLHFAHDAMGTLGFPWLSPFSMKRFRFRRGRFGVVPNREIEEWREQELQWRQQHERSGTDEISVRTPPMTLAQLLFWGAGIISLVIFLMERNWRYY